MPLVEQGLNRNSILDLEVSPSSEQLLAENTRKWYQRDITYFSAWYRYTYEERVSYPIDVNVIYEFIVQHGLNGIPGVVEQKLIDHQLKSRTGVWRHRSILRRLSAIAAKHHDMDYDSPTSSPRVKQLLRRLRRHEVAVRPSKQKQAITREVMERLLATCDESLIGLRDRALLHTAFSSGGRRRSELIRMQVSHLREVEQGYVINIPYSKSDQAGHGIDVPIYNAAARALDDWLDAAGIFEGNLFRGFTQRGELRPGMTVKVIERCIERCCRKAGLEPELFSPHSLRSGFLTECARAGITLGDAMQMSGHRVRDTALRYYRAVDLENNPAADLLK